MKCLAIDLGERRIGLALSDETGSFAHPLRTVPAGEAKATLEALVSVIAETAVELVVIGLPLMMNGEEGGAARKARAFASRLEQRVTVKVTLWDERLTTVSAERMLRDSGVKAKDQKPIIDQAAATVLLQCYLDAQRGTGMPDDLDSMVAPPGDSGGSGRERQRRGDRKGRGNRGRGGRR